MTLFHRDTVRDMGLGVGISIALFVFVSVMPLLGLVGILVLPLPVLVYRLKLGRGKGAFVVAASFTIMAAFQGSGSLDLFLFLALLLLGFALGESFERGFSIEKTMAAACGALTLAGALLMLFYSKTAGIGIQDLVSSYVKETLSLYESAMNQMGPSEEVRQALTESLELLNYAFVRVLPGFFVSGVLFIAWMAVLLARPVLHRAKLPYPNFGELTRWRAPEMLVWGVIGCGLLLLIPVSGLKFVGINGLMVLMQIYFFQGIAIVTFFFDRKKVPLMLRLVIYTIMTLQFFLLLLVVSLGFFDMWLNVRRLVPDAQSEG